MLGSTDRKAKRLAQTSDELLAKAKALLRQASVETGDPQRRAELARNATELANRARQLAELSSNLTRS